VGVGNIYASEALFHAGIRPRRSAKRITRAEFDALAKAIKATLRDAIRAGGTTLRDYVGSGGAPGAYQHETRVYGREGLPCRVCGAAIRQVRLGGRATYFCPRCQR
jgi:formamidopyrimidine-DNA glycosylase